MEMNFWLLPRLRVQAANAMATNWVVNNAPISAAVLFGHALGRRLQVSVLGVGYIHHHGEHLGELPNKKGQFQYLPQQRRGATFINKNDYSAKNKHALSLQPTATCHLTVSLVVAVDGDSVVDPEQLHSFVYGGRLAGGQIIECGEPQLFEDASSLRESLPHGFWLVERTDLINPDAPLESMLEALYPVVPNLPKAKSVKGAASATAEEENSSPEGEDEEESDDFADLIPVEGALPSDGADQEATNDRAWLVPTTLGYTTTTPYAERAFVRGEPGTLHAFCEPLVGLVQYRHTRNTPPNLPLWQHRWQSDEVFIYTHD